MLVLVAMIAAVPDGGPIRYRVLHTAALWKSGERPQLKTSVLEGDVGLAI
jgi:alkaline phosphatase D